MKFPNLIHITFDGDDKDAFLVAHETGVHTAAAIGESIPCALYKLVEVGTVIAPPSYVAPKPKKRKLKHEF
jgi:hypothetical protein